jgi:hypothetical protein
MTLSLERNLKGLSVCIHDIDSRQAMFAVLDVLEAFLQSFV